MNIQIALVGALLLVHAVLVGWIAYRMSPTIDEVGHLPAGLYSLNTGKFDVYRVNPPLVRSVAAIPVYFQEPRYDWSAYRNGLTERPEWELGQSLARANEGSQFFWYYALARWACLPFTILGGFVCFCWARDLYGFSAGLLALLLWCFSPNVLTWAATITPDLGGAALGVTAGYAFWQWLRLPGTSSLVLAGIALGFAELAKSTWIILYALWPICWLLYRLNFTEPLTKRQWIRQAGQLALLLLLSVYVLNTGYGFDGTFKRLGDYEFCSRSLGAVHTNQEFVSGGNRFTDSWLGLLPVPLPKDYVSGIDLQKMDFELGKWSYLRGEWKHGGWWYYYLYAAFLKIPLGTWGLLLLTIGSRFVRRGGPAAFCDELVLLLPALAVFILVSSQTGINGYFRYVLPCFPFVFIWVGSMARIASEDRRWHLPVSGLAIWAICSSLWIYPHSMSYFNEAIGGPGEGHWHLIDANIDWGQDMHYLREWLDQHPETHPVYLAYEGFIHPRYYGIRYESPPQGPPRSERGETIRSTDPEEASAYGPLPGWYIISVQRLHDRTDHYKYFLEFKPTDRIGWSMNVYHISRSEANRVRQKLGLPQLPAVENWSTRESSTVR